MTAPGLPQLNIVVWWEGWSLIRDKTLRRFTVYWVRLSFQSQRKCRRATNPSVQNPTASCVNMWRLNRSGLWIVLWGDRPVVLFWRRASQPAQRQDHGFPWCALQTASIIQIGLKLKIKNKKNKDGEQYFLTGRCRLPSLHLKYYPLS